MAGMFRHVQWNLLFTTVCNSFSAKLMLKQHLQDKYCHMLWQSAIDIWIYIHTVRKKCHFKYLFVWMCYSSWSMRIIWFLLIAESRTLDGYNKSPYPEVDEYITGLITQDSGKGVIRHWTYFQQGELLVYEIAKYRFCHNIGRHHKSNNIMWVWFRNFLWNIRPDS